jgi:hypothetical protein
MEVTDLEKIVKGEETLVNEKKKVAETIRNDCDGELTSGPNLIRQELRLNDVFMLLILLSTFYICAF